VQRLNYSLLKYEINMGCMSQNSSSSTIRACVLNRKVIYFYLEGQTILWSPFVG